MMTEQQHATGEVTKRSALQQSLQASHPLFKVRERETERREEKSNRRRRRRELSIAHLCLCLLSATGYELDTLPCLPILILNSFLFFLSFIRSFSGVACRWCGGRFRQVGGCATGTGEDHHSNESNDARSRSASYWGHSAGHCQVGGKQRTLERKRRECIESRSLCSAAFLSL